MEGLRCRGVSWSRHLLPPLRCRLAQTGEGIKECELVQWFVGEGDSVEEFGRVCEVQSDKATFEITSPYAGALCGEGLRNKALRLLVRAGGPRRCF